MILTSLTLDDLKNLISQSVQETIAATIKEIEGNKLRTRKETANQLNVTLPTLSSYTKKGLIISQGIGGRVQYRQSDIEAATKTIKKYGVN